jgi:5-deoxy-glucuronate isomerase
MTIQKHPTSKWFFKNGELAAGPWSAHIDAVNPPSQPWAYTGIRIGEVSPSNSLELPADTNERVIFILQGDEITVEYQLDDALTATQILSGRESVFHGPADVLYLPINTSATITGKARIAVGEAPAKSAKAPKFTAKEDVPILIRGAGHETRQVHNFGLPDSLDADRLIVCEVLVPAGNSSGAPSHKHDQYIPGKESNLEEIYYFESAVTRSADVKSQTNPFGYFRGYSADSREYDVAAEIHSGDIALVPYGWHGPATAGPGYDLYFFNVMAGPDPERAWNATDHPDHVWIRQAWQSQATDPRLPYGE